MMCALTAAQRGRRVVLLDHARKLAEKIRISGGGRCNFTNLHTRPENYLSGNPHFCRSALTRYTPQHFIALMQKHGLHYHEKTQGQLFCNEGSEAIIAMLKRECDQAGVRWCMPCTVQRITRGSGYTVQTSCGTLQAEALVIATGGISIPKIGATPFGYQVAEQFGIAMTRIKPGLVPLTFHPEAWAEYAGLAGVSLPVEVVLGKQRFRENLLFTHRSLSGPAILQISSYWEAGQALSIDLLPDTDIGAELLARQGSRMLLGNLLGQYLPQRLADLLALRWLDNRPVNQLPQSALRQFAQRLKGWQITPTGTLGYGKAEVTCGGVDTRALSSRTMECRTVPGLYFIGEVVDVTGQLGGYNFQWAWASGHAAGGAV